jgi:hypothetical protein
MVTVTSKSMSKPWSKDGYTLQAGTTRSATVPNKLGDKKAAINYTTVEDTKKVIKTKATSMVKKAIGKKK